MSVYDASKIVIDDSRVMLQIVASLNDDSIGIIYDRNMFIVQTPVACTINMTPLAASISDATIWSVTFDNAS